MKNKIELRSVLVTAGLLGLVGVKAIANEKIDISQLRSLESLSPEERIVAHDRIRQFLVVNPDVDTNQFHFVFDKEGKIYVIDKKQFDQSPVANPSCVGTY